MALDTAVNLLIVDANPTDVDRLRAYLAQSESKTSLRTEIRVASSLKEARAALLQKAADLALVDLELPDSAGLETLRALAPALTRTATIVMAHQENPAIALAALDIGVQDFLLKNELTATTLSRALRFALQRSRRFMSLTQLQNQLFQSQKLESTGRLAAGMAHDFNNQFAIVTLLCSLIENDLPEGHRAHRHVEQIQTVGRRSSDMIKQLLAFSRRHPMELQVIDLERLLKDNQAKFAQILGSSVQLVIRSSPNAFVRLDVSLMEQALVHLLMNARDAMANKGILTITLNTDENAGLVRLMVADTGKGVDEPLLEKIFEPFFTTKEIGQGIGLGLSMVYGTVKQSGGDIRAESVIGQGTTFFLTFPLVENQQADSTTRAGNLKTSPGEETILLVEDEGLLREVTRQILELHKYNVIVAEDGAKALQIILEGRTPIDLILTDLSMPNMGGLELREKVLNVRPDMRVIFTSGVLMPLENEALENVAYLAKPASSPQLLNKIREMLSRNS